MATLSVVATPIGNLKDISPRALETLRGAEVVLAEDTRVTQKLLSHYGITTRIRRYNEKRPGRTFKDVKLLLEGERNLALVSDAGTPGISDPGAKLVRFVMTEVPGAKVEVIPGPSAVTAALSVSGIPAHEFTFLGYPPAKRKRKAFFKKLADTEVRPVVIYESPHRLLKTLTELADALGEDKEVFIGRELTKMYEEHFSSTLLDARERFRGERVKGEFVIVIW